MRWAEGFIAVDWGTTNRRGYLISGDGRCTAEMEDDQGILAVGQGKFPAAVAQIRERLGDRPLLMAGMVGSNRGWIEAPYVPCPAGLSDLADRLIWAEEGEAAIVPGLSYLSDECADVMRGEEVQILGAVAAGLVPDNCLICHPGTHNKWINVVEGRIISFRTVMTGEMFNLLKEYSILADLLAEPATEGAAFHEGVRRGLSHDGLTAELFSVRARVLLDQMKRENAASYTSGLLIGADIRVGLREQPEAEVIVMGRPELTSLFSSALVEAGQEAREVDGEQAFVAGIRELAELIQ
ncbi:MAG TPA: 2-dehydro-3-deoxygalactonokinase [Allosphingosinicella sp.]|uniref:2-dehydro-3-deoxygalactonokinase n=1 Tax=Allosphingosinicella sp. TaxID=2823234 RepID=UPI002EDB1228